MYIYIYLIEALHFNILVILLANDHVYSLNIARDSSIKHIEIFQNKCLPLHVTSRLYVPLRLSKTRYR